MAAAPRWARDIVEREAPGAIWRWRWAPNRAVSTGTCYHERKRGFVVTGGARAPTWEVKLTLLHELAHWLLPKRLRHGPAFWRVLRQLADKYDIPIQKARKAQQHHAGARRVF